MSWSGGSDVRSVAVICGPTAAGKSAIAMELARRTGALLISADSRQVYRGFDIGTAKPSAADQASVVHRGIDVIEPTQRYSAAEWSASALEWMSAADANGQPVIVVGGTGFYLRAMDSPLFESPYLDPARRGEVLTVLDGLTTDELRQRCTEVDPARAALGRTQLLRALEIFMLTGRPLSAWLVENARPAQVQARYLLVDPGAALRERIAGRVAQMLAQGWEAEVAQLAALIPRDAPAWNACGYAMLRAALYGEMSRDGAITRTITDTRQYAKRQRTWFRHQLPAARVTPLDPASPGAQSRAATWLETASLSEHL